MSEKEVEPQTCKNKVQILDDLVLNEQFHAGTGGQASANEIDIRGVETVKQE